MVNRYAYGIFISGFSSKIESIKLYSVYISVRIILLDILNISDFNSLSIGSVLVATVSLVDGMKRDKLIFVSYINTKSHTDSDYSLYLYGIIINITCY